jgi:hypothetical protein
MQNQLIFDTKWKPSIQILSDAEYFDRTEPESEKIYKPTPQNLLVPTSQPPKFHLNPPFVTEILHVILDIIL